MSAPEMRSPAPRANAGNRANRKSLTRTADSTKPSAPPDFAAHYLANRYRVPLPIAAVIARLAELGGGLS
jgi:hypothetical protein